MYSALSFLAWDDWTDKTKWRYGGTDSASNQIGSSRNAPWTDSNRKKSELWESEICQIKSPYYCNFKFQWPIFSCWKRVRWDLLKFGNSAGFPAIKETGIELWAVGEIWMASLHTRRKKGYLGFKFIRKKGVATHTLGWQHKHRGGNTYIGVATHKLEWQHIHKGGNT